MGDCFHMAYFVRKDHLGVFEVACRNCEKELKPKDKLLMECVIRNPEDYPLFDLQVYAVIMRGQGSRIDEKDSSVWGNFLLESDLVMPARKERHLEFTVELPEYLPAGSYTMQFSLMQGQKFSLFGSPYLNANKTRIPPKNNSISFTILSERNQRIFIDSSGMVIDDGRKKEAVRENRDIQVESGEVTVSFDLVNELDVEEDVVLAFDWINLRQDQFSRLIKEEHNRQAVIEKVRIGAHERKRILRKMFYFNKKSCPENSGRFTMLSVTASSPGGKSFVYARLVVESELFSGAILRWPGISRFPIKSGESFDIFVGFQEFWGFLNCSLPRFSPKGRPIKLAVDAHDKKGSSIGNLLFDGIANHQIRFWKNTVIAKKDIDYIRLVARLYDKKGRQDDYFELIYDSSKLNLNQPL